MFGAGEILDIYYAAFKVPDLVFALVASLVSAYVLIPHIASLLEEKKKERAQELISQTTTFLVLAGGLICILVALFTEPFLRLFFPSMLTGVYGEEFVLLTRLLLIQPVLLGLSSIFGSVTQIKRRFFLFALSPVLYNLGIILGTLLWYPRYGVTGIGVGVIVGACAHLALHLPIVSRAGLMPTLCIPSKKILWSIMRDSLPRSLALALGSVTTLILLALASRTGEGNVAVYTFAVNLEAVPLSLIGAAYATAAFPVMATQIGRADREAFRETLTSAARHIIFWCSVITVLTIVLRAHIVRIVLGSGSFNWDDTRLTAALLAVLVVGLLAQSIILLSSRAFYASKKSWNPLIVRLGDVGVSVLTAYGMLALAHSVPMVRYFMESLFRINDVPHSSVLFIALGATVGQVIMGAVALYTLSSVAPGVARSLMRPLFEGLGAAILGGAATYGTLAFVGTIAPLTSLPVVFAEGAIAGMVGLVVAGSVLSLLENKEFKDLVSSLKKLTSARSLSTLPPHASPND
jgi:putative peptidoglycan lipid II flippase